MTAVRLPAVRAGRGGFTPLVASACLAGAVALAVLVDQDPRRGLAVPAALAALLLVVRIPPRGVIGSVLLFLPFQDLLISLSPASLQLPLRYAPELLVDAFVVTLLLREATRRQIMERFRPIVLPLAGLLVFWIVGAFWNAVPISSMLVGLRSEFRFLPLAVVAALLVDVRRDGRFLLKILTGIALVQCGVAFAEVVGGPAVRSIFAPGYELVVGGATVGAVGPPLDTIFGTLPHRNDLGSLLAFSWIVLAAAGRDALGVSRRAMVFILTVIASGVVVSASREGGVALLIGALIIAHGRLRVPVVAIAALGLFAVFLLTTALVPNRPDERTYIIDPNGNVYSYLHGTSLVERWHSVFTREAWTPSYYTNFRLFLLSSNAGLVARESPIDGFGIGSVSDPTTINRPTNPALKTFAGRKAIEQGFIYDGNWAVLVLEVGLGGLALLALFFAALVRLGLRVDRVHWSGLALAAAVGATVVLGFFAPTLQHRAPTAILWMLAGLALAALASSRTSDD